MHAKNAYILVRTKLMLGVFDDIWSSFKYESKLWVSQQVFLFQYVGLECPVCKLEDDGYVNISYQCTEYGFTVSLPSGQTVSIWHL